MHESVQYYVDRLEWGERKAYVHRIDADHYTYANRAVTLKPLDVFAEGPAAGGRRVHGEVMVASLVTLFKKLKFGTDENVGWGPIDLPELELQTTAYWLTAEGAGSGWRRNELDVALMGAGRAIQTVAAVLLMVDPRDLGLVTQVRSPHHEAPTIYLYEAVPGGIGLSPRLWERHEELVAAATELIRSCDCESGCPACTGPRMEPDVDARALALRLLDRLSGPVSATEAPLQAAGAR
jgi:DEAD/DEAH box helicase domain-containing protein